MRINIIVPDEDLRLLDDYCDRNGYKRSSFLVLAAKRLMEQEMADPRLQRLENQTPPPVKTKEYPKVLEEKIDRDVKTVLKKVKEKQEEKGIKFCKHGRMPGLCEYGCK